MAKRMITTGILAVIGTVLLCAAIFFDKWAPVANSIIVGGEIELCGEDIAIPHNMFRHPFLSNDRSVVIGIYNGQEDDPFPDSNLLWLHKKAESLDFPTSPDHILEYCRDHVCDASFRNLPGKRGVAVFIHGKLAEYNATYHVYYYPVGTGFRMEYHGDEERFTIIRPVIDKALLLAPSC